MSFREFDGLILDDPVGDRRRRYPGDISGRLLLLNDNAGAIHPQRLDVFNRVIEAFAAIAPRLSHYIAWCRQVGQ